MMLMNPLEDRRYRISVLRYNDLRSHLLDESMKTAEVSAIFSLANVRYLPASQELVTVDFDAIAKIRKMITAFADSQRYPISEGRHLPTDVQTVQ
jgi:hypothetical protein